MFQIFLILLCVPLLESRRGRGSSRSDSWHLQLVTPSNYMFAHNINNTCHYSGRSTDVPNYSNIINNINSIISDIKSELGNPDCGGMSLTTMVTISDTEPESLHRSLTSILAHLYVMKMDWMLTRGVPCVGYAKSWTIRTLHSRLIDNWIHYLCEFVSSINLENNESLQRQVSDNLSEVLSSPVLRYQQCYSKTIRDCTLLRHANSLVRTFESSPSQGRTVVTI